MAQPTGVVVKQGRLAGDGPPASRQPTTFPRRRRHGLFRGRRRRRHLRLPVTPVVGWWAGETRGAARRQSQTWVVLKLTIAARTSTLHNSAAYALTQFIFISKNKRLCHKTEKTHAFLLSLEQKIRELFSECIHELCHISNHFADHFK